MGKLVKEVLPLVFVPILVAVVYESYVFIGPRFDWDTLRWFAFGAFGYLIVSGMMGSRMAFIEFFEHEVGHMLMAWVFFRRVETFIVNTDPDLDLGTGGAVAGRGSGNLLITLAPYFLPVFSVPFVLLKLLFPGSHVLDAAIGATLAFHYVALLKEFRADQPDIADTGWLFSFIVVGVFNAVILVVILCVVQDDFSGLREYFASLYERSRETYRWVVQRLREV